MQTRPPSRTPIVNPKLFLGQFAAVFVVPDFQERFVHEALNKPLRLATRICHSIEQIFPASNLGDKALFGQEDWCVPIWGTKLNFRRCQWSDLECYLNRGAGVLIASDTCDRFYAETESEYGTPYLAYSGVSNTL